MLSGLASLSLTAMANPPLAPAEDAESYFASSFAWAYERVGYGWAAEIISVGELVTLTVVVLVGFVAQPRLQVSVLLFTVTFHTNLAHHLTRSP